MAEFRPMIITNRGRDLLTNTMLGDGNIDFTKIEVSSKVYDDAQINELTQLEDVKQTTPVSRIEKRPPASVQVEGVLTNTELETGYYMNTIALYARNPDDKTSEEFIYAACGAIVPGWMPPYNGVTATGAFLKLITTVTNSDNVIINIDPVGVATIGDIQNLQEQVSDLQAFIGYTDEDIFGVEVDFKNKKFTRLAGAVGKTPGADFDSVNAFGGRKRCNVSNDGYVTAYYGDDAYTETGKLTKDIQIDYYGHPIDLLAGEPVQVMVEQPKFYYKVVPLELEKTDDMGYHMRKVRYYISDTKKAGFKVHPAFIFNGGELDKIYLSAYEACLFDVDTKEYYLDNPDMQSLYYNDCVLSSIANAFPTTDVSDSTVTEMKLSINKFREMAQNREFGWSLMTIQSISATQMLFLIEYATFNVQTAIGLGVVRKGSNGAYNAEKTGMTAIFGNQSGCIPLDEQYPNLDSVVSYRGEENIYGNINTFVDGIRIHNDWRSVVIYSQSVSDDYETTNANPGITLPNSSGFISAFGYGEEDFDWLFLPTETTGTNSLPVGDYYTSTSSTETKYAAVGGYWAERNQGKNAGLFDWTFTYSSTLSNQYTGARLLYTPL